ncbi:unnamed protein product [Amoebophrya sp. A25]|nr:unnamed protein product [Amoebophrya sp. A25]|eukprot:GSA25T00025949001.1
MASATTHAGLSLSRDHSLLQNCGLPRHMKYEESAVLWMQKLLRDKMVDVWAQVYGERARERFTVWNQFTSDRTESNNGSRIDFILLSKPLWELYCRTSSFNQEHVQTTDGTSAGSSAEPTDLKPPASTDKAWTPPPGSIVRKLGYIEQSEVGNLASSGPPGDTAPSSWPMPIPLAGSFDPVRKQMPSTASSSSAPPLPRFVSPELASRNAATCYGGWINNNRFGSAGGGFLMQKDSLKDDLRLNNFQFAHSEKSCKLLKAPLHYHWSNSLRLVGEVSSSSECPQQSSSPDVHTSSPFEDKDVATNHISSPLEDIEAEHIKHQDTSSVQKRHIANMIYTPPSYSDHIMLSLFLPDEILAALPVTPAGIPPAQTQATAPWRYKTRTLLSFMGSSSSKPLQEPPLKKLKLK